GTVVGAWGQGWVRTYGGTGDQGGTNILGNWQAGTSTLGGGFMAVASTWTQSGSGIYLLKTDSNGDILIEKWLYDGEYAYSSLSDVELLQDGGFIVVGAFNDTSYLKKFDENLEIVWTSYNDD